MIIKEMETLVRIRLTLLSFKHFLFYNWYLELIFKCILRLNFTPIYFPLSSSWKWMDLGVLNMKISGKFNLLYLKSFILGVRELSLKQFSTLLNQKKIWLSIKTTRLLWYYKFCPNNFNEYFHIFFYFT